LRFKKKEKVGGYVGLRGTHPGSELVAPTKINPTLLALSATTHVAKAAVSPEAVWGDAETKFPNPEISTMSFSARDLLCRDR